ncbi:MAG: hypothetical protein ACJ78Q_13010 [Chloroflexia bacterium]
MLAPASLLLGIYMTDFGAKTLFNAARRYCIDTSPGPDRVAERSMPEAQVHEVWAANSMLSAILNEIERAILERFHTVEQMREYLLAAGLKAKVISGEETSHQNGELIVLIHEPRWDEDERAAAERALSNYLEYIASLSAEEAVKAAPVLYRHRMSETQRRSVRKKLAKRWDVAPRSHTWFPLRGEPLPPDVLALQDAWFDNEVGAEKLREILLAHGITRIWEIHESLLGPEYEFDPRLCNFWGVETYWSSQELTWMVYKSHESSITFAGYWLINAIQKAWPNWEQRIYTGYDYEKPTDAIRVPFINP